MKGIPVRQSSSFNIRNISTMTTGADLEQPLHRHDFFYILALENGSGEHEIDFVSCEVNDHSLFFLRPGQVHRLRIHRGSSGYILSFTPDFYHSELLRKVGNVHVYPAGSIAAAIFNEYTRQQPGYEDVIRAYLTILLTDLSRHNPTPSVRSYEQEKLEDFMTLLETHITTHKQVAQYAALLHLSPYQINTITKSTVGKTCSQLINEQVVLEAKRLLLATTRQVSQIADILGYEDVSYFIRFFKKHTGFTPEIFRQQYH